MACEKNAGVGHNPSPSGTDVPLSDVSRILANVPLGASQMQEVYDAVSSSSGNGYDEEYTMKNLFNTPGTGVGDSETKSAVNYDQPLKDLIESYLREQAATKAYDVNCDSPEDYMESLMSSDIQIYWPFSEQWDGKTLPIITYDPEDGSNKNVGFRIDVLEDGSRHIERIIVDESMAEETPVWVVNRNSDAGYKTLQMLKKENPGWDENGGSITLGPQNSTKSSPVKSLYMKNFKMNRHYDCWFAGASEFFVKVGYVDNFIAVTEAELRLYNPMVTDFMVVVKRKQLGETLEQNVILMTEWPEQMSHCALLMIEDDGGTQSSWNCKASVIIESKSYGIDLVIPFKVNDDIVWRGQLSTEYIEENSNIVSHFGDVDVTFELK